MKKIVIVSDSGPPATGLIACLSGLFPDCAIEILEVAAVGRSGTQSVSDERCVRRGA